MIVQKHYMELNGTDCMSDDYIKSSDDRPKRKPISVSGYVNNVLFPPKDRDDRVARSNPKDDKE